MNRRVGPPFWAYAFSQAVLLLGLWIALAVLVRPRLAAITFAFIFSLAIVATVIGIIHRQPRVLVIACATGVSVGLIFSLASVPNTVAALGKLMSMLTEGEQIILLCTIVLLASVGLWLIVQTWMNIGELLPQGWATPLWVSASPSKVRPLRRIS